MTGKKVSPDFYLNDTKVIAQQLLGKRLVRVYKNKILSGRIVETEAYLGVKDKAAHTFNGRLTNRTKAMYLEGGHCYVYFIYGMHFCFNVVTQKEGTPEAVLIRALEPIDGIDVMKRLRKSTDIYKLTSGPGRLCQAMKIDKTFNAQSLLEEKVYIVDDLMYKKNMIFTTPRINVDYAKEASLWKLRFFVKGSPFVSC